MGNDQEILTNLKKPDSSSPPILTTPFLTDELDRSLDLNDFELSLIRDFISDGSPPDDETLAVFSVTNVEFSDVSTVLPQHQSKSPEDSENFPVMDAILPAFRDAIDGTLHLDSTTRQCKEVVSDGKDRRAPTLDKETFPGRRYRGVKRTPGGRFSAAIKVRNPEKKGKDLWLGTYDTEEEAAMAFDRAALKYRGSQAVLNLPHLIGSHADSPKIIPPRKSRQSRRFHRRLRRRNHQEATT